MRAPNRRYLPPERFFDGDSVRFYRQAQMVVEHGALPAADAERWLPEGRSLSRYPTLSSYALAAAYWVGRRFSDRWTLPTAAFWYPVICFLASVPVVFWLSRRVSSSACATATSALYCLLPVGVRHSVVAYCDRDALVLFLSTLCLGLYLASLDQPPGRRRWSFVLASALVMSLLVHTWEGAGLFVAATVLGYTLQSLFGRSSRLEAAGHAVWSVLVMAAMASFTGTYRLPLQAYSALAWLVVLAGFSWAAADAVLPWRAGGPSLATRAALRMAILALPVVSLLLAWSDAPASLLEHLMAPLGRNRLMVTVGELQKPDLTEWYRAFGIVGWLGVTGAAVVGLGLASGSRYRVAAIVSVAGFVVFGVVAPGLLSPAGKVSADTLFLAGLGMWAAGWLVAGLSLRRRRSRVAASGTSQEVSPGTQRGEPYLLMWFFVMLAAARSSLRFDLFLLPIACVLTAVVLREMLHQLSSAVAAEVLAYAMVVAIGLGAVSQRAVRADLPPAAVALLLAGLALPLLRIGMSRTTFGALFGQAWPVLLLASMAPLGAAYANAGVTRLGGVPASPFGHLTGVLRWLRQHASQSVVGAWWDYGSWLNCFGCVRTIIDEDHYEPYRIHLFARHVYGAQSPGQALSFLKTYGADYLLLTRHDLDGLSSVSFIGMLGPSGAGLSLAKSLGLRETKLSNGSVILDSVTPRPWPYQGYGHRGPSAAAYLASVELDATGARPVGGSLVLYDGPARVDLVPRFVQVGGIRLESDRPSCAYGLVCHSFQVEGRPVRCLYVVGPEHAKLLAVRLFLLRERIPGFHLVFHDGTAALWRVGLPGVRANPMYLRTDFSDAKVRRAWMLRR